MDVNLGSYFKCLQIKIVQPRSKIEPHQYKHNGVATITNKVMHKNAQYWNGVWAKLSSNITGDWEGANDGSDGDREGATDGSDG